MVLRVVRHVKRLHGSYQHSNLCLTPFKVQVWVWISSTLPFIFPVFLNLDGLPLVTFGMRHSNSGIAYFGVLRTRPHIYPTNYRHLYGAIIGGYLEAHKDLWNMPASTPSCYTSKDTSIFPTSFAAMVHCPLTTSFRKHSLDQRFHVFGTILQLSTFSRHTSRKSAAISPRLMDPCCLNLSPRTFNRGRSWTHISSK